MNTDELPIIQYWHEADVPMEVAELTSTFRDLNPAMQHMLFSEAAAERFIADHFTDREVTAFRACAVPAMQSDYLRYCATFILGGIYADVDFRCRRPLHDLIPADGGGLYAASRGGLVNGFFFFTSPGHPLLRLAIDMATHSIEQRAAGQVWMITGPAIFTGIEALHRLGPSLLLKPTRGFVASKLALEAVGGYERAIEAFDGVRVEPLETADDWVCQTELQPVHRSDQVHWSKWSTTIFR